MVLMDRQNLSKTFQADVIKAMRDLVKTMSIVVMTTILVTTTIILVMTILQTESIWTQEWSHRRESVHHLSSFIEKPPFHYLRNLNPFFKVLLLKTKYNLHNMHKPSLHSMKMLP
jgi:hypothetical protein